MKSRSAAKPPKAVLVAPMMPPQTDARSKQDATLTRQYAAAGKKLTAQPAANAKKRK